MKKTKANAVWNGTIKEGKGKVKLPSVGYETSYTFASRFESGSGTNPEELIGAALAGCFSMALSLGLTEEGFNPDSIDTDAEVSLVESGGGFAIDSIHLTTRAKIESIDKDKFMKLANDSKENCPVSQALKGVKISLDADLT
jgi:osmotically inducible protein OsmC